MSYFYDDDDYYNNNNRVNYYILTVLKIFGIMLLILFGYMTFKVVTSSNYSSSNQITTCQTKQINY